MDDPDVDPGERLRRLVVGVHQDRRLELIDELVAETVRVRTASGAILEGRAAYRKRMERASSEFRGNTIDVAWTISEGPRAAIETTMQTTMEGSYLDVRAIGDERTLRVLFCARLNADGRIEELSQTFDTRQLLSPAQRAGRGAVLEQLHGGVLVLDRADRIVDANSRALRLLEADRDDARGTSVHAVLEDVPEPAISGDGGVVDFEDGRLVEISGSPLRDDDGDPVGRILVLRDVTERIRRNQQLTVLNRVLRHNVRNDLSVVKGILADLSEHLDAEGADPVRTAREATDRILETSDTARRFQSALERSERRAVDVGAATRRVAERAGEEFPHAEVETRIPDEVLASATLAIEDALWELVQNACRHASPNATVKLELHVNADNVTIEIADDGPGIPDHEVAVIERGDEDPLRHGSGLGLWMVSWVVESSGGELAFDRPADGGTSVRVLLQRPGDS